MPSKIEATPFEPDVPLTVLVSKERDNRAASAKRALEEGRISMKDYLVRALRFTPREAQMIVSDAEA